ncbi:MAG: hypothetical protein KatS3mg078_2323 [Deltaproteobacteria bacterium]|nr:MAG: hypothetical protein KatS3mg078_2323 [Deltaproteobacteria bacterium]
MKKKALETRFIADSMLGKLAKWLRLAGVDVEYEKDIDDKELIQRAIFEDRVILTRDRSVTQRKLVKECLLINSEHLSEQIREFKRAFELNTLKNAFTRCILCNNPLEEIPKELLKGKVPPYIWNTHERFKHCNRCKRVYWAGTHRRNAEKLLKELIEESDLKGEKGLTLKTDYEG